MPKYGYNERILTDQNLESPCLPKWSEMIHINQWTGWLWFWSCVSGCGAHIAVENCLWILTLCDILVKT